MKKIIFFGLFLMASAQIFADCEDGILRAKPDPMALTTAIMGIASQLLSTLPSLIQDIAQFPSLAQADAIALENQMKIAATLVGNAKQKAVQQLFVEGVNLTILVTNIINKLMILISSIGPLAVAIDPVNGAKVQNSLQLTALILQMISKIDIAMKNSIIAGGSVSVSPIVAATPALDPIPNL